MKIYAALATADGRYRVEVVQQGSRTHYRLIRDEQIWHDRIAIGSLPRLLGDEGVDMAELHEVPVEISLTDFERKPV